MGLETWGAETFEKVKKRENISPGPSRRSAVMVSLRWFEE